MSLAHPRILLRPSWRRDVESPLVVLGTYCRVYVIDVYSYYSTHMNNTALSSRTSPTWSSAVFSNNTPLLYVLGTLGEYSMIRNFLLVFPKFVSSHEIWDFPDVGYKHTCLFHVDLINNQLLLITSSRINNFHSPTININTTIIFITISL